VKSGASSLPDVVTVSSAPVVVVSAAAVDVEPPDSVVVVGSTVDPVVSEPPAQPATTNAKTHEIARLFIVDTVGDRVFIRNK
jgi:hypothetical protein